MQINHGVYKGVKIKWDSITLPLKEGTPINIGGNIANNGTAIGLVPQNYFVRPLTSDEIDILVGGDVELEEVEKSSGLTLTTEAKSSMSGIKFHLSDGHVDDSADSSYTLPTASASTLGGVKVGTNVSIDEDGKISVPSIPVAANVAASEATALADLVTSFNALLSALKTAGMMEADSDAE